MREGNNEKSERSENNNEENVRQVGTTMKKM